MICNAGGSDRLSIDAVTDRQAGLAGRQACIMHDVHDVQTPQ